MKPVINLFIQRCYLKVKISNFFVTCSLYPLSAVELTQPVTWENTDCDSRPSGPAIGAGSSWDEALSDFAAGPFHLISSSSTGSLLLRNCYIIYPLVTCFLEQFHKLGKVDAFSN